MCDGKDALPFGRAWCIYEVITWLYSGKKAIYLSTGAEPEMYFFGLIDILTVWCPAKRSEFTVKALMHPTKWRGISCQAPDLYANRFERALRKWFV